MVSAPKDACCFCGRPGDASVPGELAELLSATLPHLGSLRFHEACASYSTGIAAGRLIGGSRIREPWRHGQIPAQRVAAEHSRGASLDCDVCGRRGATLACRGISACGRSYHLPCAREAAQRGSVVFSEGVLECACAQHADGIPDPIDEPAGLWFEKFGGWDNQRPEVERQWAAQQRKRQRLAPAEQAGAEPGDGGTAGAESRLAPDPAARAEGKALKEVDGVIYVDISSEEEGGGDVAAQQPPPPQQAAQPNVPPSFPSAAAHVLPRPSWRPTKAGAEAQPQPSAASCLDGPGQARRRLRRLQHEQPGAQQGVRLTGRGDAQQAAVAAVEEEDSSEAEDAPPPSPTELQAPAMTEEQEVTTMQQEVRDVRRCYLLPGHKWVQGGDVAGPPPHAAGSMVVLNTVIPYPTAFRRVTREYVRRMEDATQPYVAVAVLRNEHLLDESQRRSVGRRIQNFIRRGAGLGKKGRLTPEKLPECLPVANCGERFRIPEDDERVGLAADPAPLGWRNRKGSTVPKHTVLGAYQALQLLNFSYQEMINDTELARQMELPPSQLSLFCEAYGADSAVGHDAVLPGQEHLLEPLFERFRQIDDDSNNLTFSAWGLGNAMALINDVARDPLKELDEGKQALSNLPSGPNCTFVEALVFGWPFLFVVTVKEVPAKEEFLLEYGKHYWAGIRREKLRSRATEAEQAALREKLEAAQREAMAAQAAEQRATSTQLLSAQPPADGKLAGLETQASGTAAAGSGAGGSVPADGAGAAVPAVAVAGVPAASQPGAAGQEAAVAAAQRGGQGSPPRQLAGAEECATSPGPQPSKAPQPLRIPPAARPAASQRPGSSQQDRSRASDSKRGAERRRSRSRSRSRSRRRRRGRSRNRSRSRCRSRDRRGRSRSRSRSRQRRRSPPRPAAQRPGSGGPERAAAGRDDKRGRSRSRSRGRIGRSGPMQQERGGGGRPLQQLSEQAGSRGHAQRMLAPRPAGEPAPANPIPQPTAALPPSTAFFWQPQSHMSGDWLQQHQEAAAAASVAGGWADSPQRAPPPGAEVGGTPDLAEVEAQEAGWAAAQRQRSVTPDLLEVDDAEGRRTEAPRGGGGVPLGFGLPHAPVGPPSWQGPPPALAQSRQQVQQQPYNPRQPAPAPLSQQPAPQRARSATPDLGPEVAPAQHAQRAQQAQRRERAVTPDMDDVQLQDRPAAVPAQQHGHPGPAASMQHPAAAGWRQPTGAWAQRDAAPASKGAAAAGAPPAAAAMASIPWQPRSNAWKPAGSSARQWPVPVGPGPAGRQQQHQPTFRPSYGHHHAASVLGVATGEPARQTRAPAAVPAAGARVGGTAAARAALPEPQAVGRPGSYRERHPATAFGLKAPPQQGAR